MEYDKEDWLRIALFVPVGLILIGHACMNVDLGNYLDLAFRIVEFIVGVFLVLYGFFRDSVEDFFENRLLEVKQIR